MAKPQHTPIVLLVAMATTWQSSFALDVPSGVTRTLRETHPGYKVNQLVRGTLIDGGAEEIALVVAKDATAEESWPTFSFVVMEEVGPGAYRTVAASCPDTFNPVGGHDIEIKRRSLFTEELFGGMETSETHRNQYRFDGRKFQLIGSEYNRHYHGDDADAAKNEEVRQSRNFLTGRYIEYSATGVHETVGAVPEPEYLDCVE